jgi:hypothetical protein
MYGDHPLLYHSKDINTMSLLLMIISNLLGFIFLKHKNDVCNAFSLFKSQVEIFFTSKIKNFRTDGGAKYKLIIK